MKKNINLSLITAFASLALATGCDSKGKELIEPAVETMQIKVEQVFEQDIPQLSEYTAIVEANAVNNIAPTMAGRIDKIYVEVGDNVRKGQLLAQMDENNLQQSKAKLDNLEITFKRIDELYKVGGISKSDWDAQKTNLEITRTAYHNLIDNTQLISPISGIITARNYDSGDLYAGNPILQVQQIIPVKMIINVSEMNYTKIKKGMTAKVKIDVYDDEEFIGKINLIYPTIDAKTHTFPVEIIIANSNAKIRPGMYAKVTLDLGSERHVLVPDVSIIKQQGSGDRFVYIYKDGKVFYNKITLGRRIEDNYELISGVSDSDYVAITSLSKLNNEMKVEIVK